MPRNFCLFSVKFFVRSRVCISPGCIFLGSCIRVCLPVLPGRLCFSASLGIFEERNQTLESVQPTKSKALWEEAEASGGFADNFLFSFQPSFPLSDPSRVPGHTLLQIIRNSAGDVATLVSADTTNPLRLVCRVFGQPID